MTPEHPFDEAATARVALDDEGVLTEWNEGARRLLGWTAAEVVGRPATDLVADGSLEPVRELGGDRRGGTLTLRHRDGRTLPVWLLVHPRPEGWLVLAPLDSAPLAPDDPLAHIDLMQSPCAMAVHDDRMRLRRANDSMTRALGLPEERLRGLKPTEVSDQPHTVEMEQHMRQVLATGRGTHVRFYVPFGSHGAITAWLALMAPVTDAEGRVRGVSVAAHDFTEQYLARERLQLVNEASVNIGTTLDVTRTAQELADVCVPALADFVSVDLLDPTADGDPPTQLTPPVTLRRIAHRSVHPDTPEALVRPGDTETYPAESPQATSLLTGRTITVTLPDEEVQRWLAKDHRRQKRITQYNVRSGMSVPIRARGTTLGIAVFSRYRRTDPFTPDDALLAEEITARAAVCVDNARRYSRERDTALALQRSLLPRNLAHTAAVTASSRYLPAARSGVGGDWFDVIPLSGMRVALVVGDVVGHGVQASATMGRLRTAVRTLADIDLAPEELLTHLDDLVVRLSEETGGDGSTGEVGATCLYAVYDPVSRRCSLARAGHPPPVLVPPGGAPREVDLPAGPPLGVGGLPFESAELSLAEGSLLAFFTNGLIESPLRDENAARALLREALTDDAGSLEQTCDRVLHALMPRDGSAADDVALLLARTCGLPPSQVATWDIPADPSLVAPIRKQVLDQLGDWDLSDASFTTELVVSELVTNAIRYGAPPIRLRLIHDASTLICEVSDTSHTAPHLRRAKTWDEGGRGLLLVAQLTQRWGSRHTTEGKTIWAELTLLEPDEG
ncbi:SpoIIE family protein phosphatase [Streptomyces sp. NPDC006997]|uniref:SpoIIE family protein phosphatase n=1 Tax=Streptomyces sp. NPDC006997 TaxID=3155356 RepID=UPI0033F74F07